MEHYFQAILNELGDDTQREDLRDTPRRAAEAMRYLTRGYQQSLADVVTHGIFPCKQNGLVMVKSIEYYSLCEHHLLPFMGKCHVAYLPKDHVLGLSKIASIVELYARRLQIQERLTQQIADAINATIEPQGVGVILEAQHLCMMMRGVEKQQATVTTSVMLGEFHENAGLRLEILTAIK